MECLVLATEARRSGGRPCPGLGEGTLSLVGLWEGPSELSFSLFSHLGQERHLPKEALTTQKH